MKKLIKEPKAVDAINQLLQIEDKVIVLLLKHGESVFNNDSLNNQISAVIHDLQQQPKGTIEIYKGCDGWRWTALGDNGEPIGSGESYVNKKDMMGTISKYYSTFKVVEKQKGKK